MKSKIRVAFLSYDGLTDPLGQSQILPYMTGLSQRGFSISIFSFEKSDRFSILKDQILKICNQSSIEWVPLPYHKKPPIISTLFDLFKLRRKLRAYHEKEEFKIVHCRSYPTAIVGLWMKNRFHTKFIFDMRGYWADERVEGGLWNLKNPIYYFIYRYFKIKEKDFLKSADYVVSLTNNAKDEIYSRKYRNGPIAVIPTCVDLHHFDPDNLSREKRAWLKARLGIKEEFVMLYLGSWGTWYLGAEMLAFFERLKSRRNDAKLLIVTTDRIDVKNLWYKDDIIITEASRDQVPVFISLASASMFFIKPSFSKKGTYATKMGEIMAMNVPIITNPGWGDAESIVRSAGGYLVTDEGVIDLVLEHQSTDTRNYCKKNLSLESGIDKYEEIYHTLS